MAGPVDHGKREGEEGGGGGGGERERERERERRHDINSLVMCDCFLTPILASLRAFNWFLWQLMILTFFC